MESHCKLLLCSCSFYYKLTILLFLGNLPFAIIQRYNRFRLVKLKNTLIKKAERAKKLEARKKSKTKEQVSIQDSDGEAVSG